MKSIHNKKLPAFTLVEVLVVIIISCFFVVMVYTSVHFFLLSYVREKSLKQSAGDLWALEGSLLHETENARILKASLPDTLLICIMPGGDTISYRFGNHFILRSQGNRSDTLDTGCRELQFGYHGNPIESGVIDHLALKIGYRKYYLSLQFNKIYTPEVIFNHIDTLNSIFQ